MPFYTILLVWFSEIFFKVNFDLGNKGQGQMLSQLGTTLLLGSFKTIHKKLFVM